MHYYQSDKNNSLQISVPNVIHYMKGKRPYSL